MVDNKRIGDCAVLFFWGLGVGSDSRAFGRLNGFLPHRAVDDVSAFWCDFGAHYLPGAINPDVDYDFAFFAEIIIGTVKALGTTTAKVIARAVASSAVTFVLSDACQTIRVALVARLSCDAFRTTSLWVVAASIDGPAVDGRFGLFSGFLLFGLGVFGLLNGRGLFIVLRDDIFLAVVFLLLRLCGLWNGRLLGLNVAHSLVHHA